MGVSDAEIIISYDTLFELLRREKNRDELQPLSKDFYSDLSLFIKERLIRLEQERNKMDLYSADSRYKDRKEIDNTRKLIRELYERRERKIINMALNKARTGSELIDTTALLEEERVLFTSLVNLLNLGKDQVLFSVLRGNQVRLNLSDLSQTEAKAGADEVKDHNTSGTRIVIFSNEVPRFLGPNLEVYGPFNKEDIATLPATIADILLKKGRAEELKEE